MISAIAAAPFVAYTEDAPAGLTGTIGVQIRDASDNVVLARETSIVREVVPNSGVYQANFPDAPATPGPYVVVWDTGGGSPQYATELLQVTPGSAYVPQGDITVVADLTDLAVLIPWARRACEGPYGPPQGKPPLGDDVIYPRIADACAEIILQSGKLFDHDLIVAARDPLAGYPVQWRTSEVLDQWEGALIICQTALDFWRFLVRDFRTSVSIQNEGTTYDVNYSASVTTAYLKQLQDERDKALVQLMAVHPILDRYASNIRVRDYATVGVLEYWDRNVIDQGPMGLGGGQDAIVIPFGAGWR